MGLPQKQDKLSALGIVDMDVIQTTKGTFIAPFSNTEHISYLAIQDAFPNGRPPLEKTGAYVVQSHIISTLCLK